MPTTRHPTPVIPADPAERWPAARITQLQGALHHEVAAQARAKVPSGLPLACLFALSVSTPETMTERAAKLEWLLRSGNKMTKALWRRLQRRMARQAQVA